MDPVQFSLYQKWTRSIFRSAKSGPRSGFWSAKSGPGPVFTLPMVDPIQFSKVDPSNFSSAKSGPGSSGVLWNRSAWAPRTDRFSDYDINSFITADKPLAAIYLSVLFEHYHPRYMPLSVYSHWHTHAVLVVAIRIPACCGNCFNPGATRLPDGSYKNT